MAKIPWMTAAAFVALTTTAYGAPLWSVRGDSAERAEAQLEQLDRAPASASGLRALVRAVGLARAHAMAARRAKRTRTWSASFVRGRLALAANKRTLALRSFKQALGRAGKVKAAATLLGWIGEELVAASYIKDAEKILARWIPKRPGDARALRLLARIALSRRKLKKACEYQGMLAKVVTTARVKRIHARLLAQTGQLSKSAVAYRAALKLVKKDPALRCELLRELGRLLESLEQFDVAIKRFKEAIKLTTKGGYIYRELQASILSSYRRRGALDKLIAEARAMLEADAKSRLALGVLARQLARNPRKMGEAAGFYARYLKVAATDIRARASLMFLLLRLGRTADAVVHAGKLHELQPQKPRRLLEYAALLNQLGRTKKAKEALNKGIALYKKRKHGDGLHLVARALDRLGDAAGAKAAFEAMLTLDRRGHRYRRIYGLYLWRRAKRPDALKVWGAMLGKKPTLVAYEKWLELVESVQAWRYHTVKAALRAEVGRGLRLFRRHSGLRALRGRL